MLKKILPLLLAVVMIFSLGTVTAFAAPNANTTPIDATQTGNTVEIGKVYKLENDNTTSPEETFYLIQTEKTWDPDSNSALTAADVPDLVELTGADAGGYTGSGRLVGIAEFAEGAATVAGTRENFVVKLPTYSKIGVYKYTLKEDAVNQYGGVEYNNNNNGDGFLLVVQVETDGTGLFYIAAVHCEKPVDVNDVGGGKSDNFDNIYKANSNDPTTGGISISKEVTGNGGDRGKYFDFTITFTGETGKSYANAPTVSVSATSHTGNPTSLNIKSLSKTNPLTFNFKLKHGETITFGDVPYGVEYTYAEADYSGEGYDRAYPQKDSGTTDPDTGAPVMVDDTTDVVDSIGDAYTVTNEKNIPIDTGIILDNMPYILTIALVLIGGVVFFVGKKRKMAEDRV